MMRNWINVETFVDAAVGVDEKIAERRMYYTNAWLSGTTKTDLKLSKTIVHWLTGSAWRQLVDIKKLVQCGCRQRISTITIARAPRRTSARRVMGVFAVTALVQNTKIETIQFLPRRRLHKDASRSISEN